MPAHVWTNGISKIVLQSSNLCDIVLIVVLQSSNICDIVLIVVFDSFLSAKLLSSIKLWIECLDAIVANALNTCCLVMPKIIFM
jgi:hypothetical protein